MVEPHEQASRDLDVAQAALRGAKEPAWLAAMGLSGVGWIMIGWFAVPLIFPAVYLLLTVPHKRRVKVAYALARKLHDEHAQGNP